MLFRSLISTVVGYGIWSRLMSRYPSSTVAPFSMLVPPVGVAAAWLVFGEVPDLIELIAGAVVILGVLFASGLGQKRRGTLIEPPVESLAQGVVLR